MIVNGNFPSLESQTSFTRNKNSSRVHYKVVLLFGLCATRKSVLLEDDGTFLF